MTSHSAELKNQTLTIRLCFILYLVDPFFREVLLLCSACSSEDYKVLIQAWLQYIQHNNDYLP